MAQDNKEYLDGIGVEEKVRKPKEPPYVLRHKNICKEVHEIFKKKNKDYGNSFHDTYKQFGIISAVTRMSDKWNRIINLSTGKEAMVNDESLRDTMIDLCGYLVLTILELDNEKHKRESKDKQD